MKKLYRFHWDYGRQGDVLGTFVADEADVAKTVGQELYLGEILGKHSEVAGTLEASDVTVLTDDQDFIAKFERYMGKSVGYNPLDYTPKALG